MSHLDLPLYLVIIILALLGSSALLCVTAAIGMLRMKTLLERLHTPAIVSTLGALCALVASMIYFMYTRERLVIHELIIVFLLVITSPITGLLVMKAARARFSAKELQTSEVNDEDV